VQKTRSARNIPAIPFKDMTGGQKAFFVFKVVVCILTFGMVFPTVGD
jgi:hypothetical protein